MTAPIQPVPTIEPPEPLAEPRVRDWDETPAEAAAWDRWWGDRDIDYDRDEE